MRALGLAMAKRVMLVRGGVLGRNSGLGSAHHNLADLLGSGSVLGWGCLLYTSDAADE